MICKVICHVSGADAALYKATVQQLHNLLHAMDDVLIEVAVHAAAAGMLLQSSPVAEHVLLLQQQGINFLICRNTLNDRKIAATDLLPGVEITPSVVAHLVLRQHEGWAYIKAG